MRQRYVASRKISIHLMLLFINATEAAKKAGYRFQCISCYSLSIQHSTRSTYCLSVSIHLMLLFIRRQSKSRSTEKEFQYISCYSLSKRISSTRIWESCFNTSHVTLYPILTEQSAILFSCFNTSHVTLYPWHPS